MVLQSSAFCNEMNLLFQLSIVDCFVLYRLGIWQGILTMKLNFEVRIEMALVEIVLDEMERNHLFVSTKNT